MRVLRLVSALSLSLVVALHAHPAAAQAPDVDRDRLRAMIGQMLFFEFEVDADRYVVAKGGHPGAAIADMLDLVAEFQLGGLVNEYHNDALYLDPGFAAIRKAEALDGLHPFVAVNQEGGRVQFPTRWFDRRAIWIGCTGLGAIPGFRAENPPPATAWRCPDHSWPSDPHYMPFLRNAHLMGAMWSTAETTSHAADIGRAMAQLDITMNLAPVLGVSDGTIEASFLADRTFSDDPAKVAAYAAAFSRGIVEGSGGRVVTVLKHFPSLGAVTGDTDDGPAIGPPLAALKGRDLIPYERPVASFYRASAVMMANVAVPGLTCAQNADQCALPASLSPAAYRLLREDYGWDGLVMADTLQTKAVVYANRTMPQAVVQAIAAGADMAMFKPAGRPPSMAANRQLLTDVHAAIRAWVEADPELRIPRIARSVARIKAVKITVDAALRDAE